jgi:hypothetical protein
MMQFFLVKAMAQMITAQMMLMGMVVNSMHGCLFQASDGVAGVRMAGAVRLDLGRV